MRAIFLPGQFKCFSSVSRRSFASALNQSKSTYEPISNDVVAVFGPERRLNSDEKLLKAENLLNSWRSFFQPTAACGSRSYALAGVAADLEFAILEFVCDQLKKTGIFKTMQVDDILPLSTTKACGFGEEQGGEESSHTLQYFVDNKRGSESKHCLSGTAEMGIAHNLRGKTFLSTQLPLYFMAKSRCYRAEVSKSSRETGLYRVHEFNKIEMFSVCTKEQSVQVLSKLIDIQREIFEHFEIHCRIRNMPPEDLSAAAQQKFDIEAWMPGRGVWGELSSASNCTDFQGVRLPIKYRYDDGKDNSVKTEFAHTCNGTAIATTRAIIAILETHQRINRRSVEIPECIRDYMPKRRAPTLRLANNPHFNYPA